MAIGSGSNRDITVTVKSNITSFTAGMTSVRSQLTGLQSAMAGTLNSMSSGLAGISNQLILTGAAGTGFSQYVTRLFSEALPAVEEYYKSQAKLVSLNDDLKNGTKEYGQVMQEAFDNTRKFSEMSIYSMTEVSDAMYTLGQAGYKTNQILAITPTLLQLATAQGADLKTVTEDMIGVFNAFNITIDETGNGAGRAAEVINLFAAAATASRVSMEDVHYGIKFITPTFSELGYSIETAVTAWTMLTDLGYKGENAGRILRDSMNDLMNPTAEAAEVLRKYNIQLYQNQSQYDALASTYNSVKAATDSLKESQKAIANEIQNHQEKTEKLNLEMQKLNLEAQKIKFKYGADNPVLRDLEREKDVLVENRDAAKDYYNTLKDEQTARVQEMTIQKSAINDIRRQLSEVNNEMAANRAEGFESGSPRQQALAEQKKALQDQLLEEQRALDGMKKTHTENAATITRQKIKVREASEAVQDQNKIVKKTKDELKDKEEEELRAIEAKKIAIEEEKIAQAEKLQLLQDKQREVNKEVENFTKKTEEAKKALDSFVPSGLKDLREILQSFQDSGMQLSEYGIIFGKQSAGGFKKLVGSTGKFDSRYAELIAGEGDYDAYGNPIHGGKQGEAARQSDLIMASPYGQWQLAGKQLGENATLQAFQNNINGVMDTLGMLNTPEFRSDIERIKTNLLGGALDSIQDLIPVAQGAASGLTSLGDEVTRAIGAFGMMTGLIMYVVSPALLTMGVFGSILSLLTGGLGKVLTREAVEAVDVVDDPILAAAKAAQAKKFGLSTGGKKGAGKALDDVLDTPLGAKFNDAAYRMKLYRKYDVDAVPRIYPGFDKNGKMENVYRDSAGRFMKDPNKSGLAKELWEAEKAAKAAAPAIETVGTKTSLFGRIANIATSFLGLQGLAGATAGVGGAAAGAAGSTGLLSGLWAASVPLIGGVSIALGPLLAVLGAIVGAVALVWFAWKNNWGNIQEHAANLYNWFTRNFSGLIDLFWEIKEEFDATFGQLVENFQKVWDGIANADLTTLSEGLGGIVGTVLRFMIQIPLIAFRIMGEFISNLIGGIIDGGPSFINALIAFLSDLPQIIASAGQVLIYQAANFGANLIRAFLGIKVSDEDLRKQHEQLAAMLDKGFGMIGKKSNLAEYAANEDAKTAARRAEKAMEKSKKSAEDLGKIVADGIKSNKSNDEILTDLGISTDDNTKAHGDVGAKMNQFKGLNLADFTDMFGKMDETNNKTLETNGSLKTLSGTAAEPLMAPNYDQNKFNAFNQNIMHSIGLLVEMRNQAAMAGVAAQNAQPVAAPVLTQPVVTPAPAPTQPVVTPAPAPTPTPPTKPTTYTNPPNPVTGIGTYNDGRQVNANRAGAGFGNMLASGLMMGINPVLGAASMIASGIAAFFPQSPAKTGPLTKLPEMGTKVAKQLAVGIRLTAGQVGVAAQEIGDLVKAKLDAQDFIAEQKSIMAEYQTFIEDMSNDIGERQEALKRLKEEKLAIEQLQSTLDANGPSVSKATTALNNTIGGGQKAVNGYVIAPDGTKMQLVRPIDLPAGTPMSYKYTKIPDVTQQAISHNQLIRQLQGASSPSNSQINNFTFNGSQNKSDLTQFGKRLVRKINNGRGNFVSMG